MGWPGVQDGEFDPLAAEVRPFVPLSVWLSGGDSSELAAPWACGGRDAPGFAAPRRTVWPHGPCTARGAPHGTTKLIPPFPLLQPPPLLRTAPCLRRWSAGWGLPSPCSSDNRWGIDSHSGSPGVQGGTKGKLGGFVRRHLLRLFLPERADSGAGGEEAKPPKLPHPSWQEVVCAGAGAQALSPAVPLPAAAAAVLALASPGVLLRKALGSRGSAGGGVTAQRLPFSHVWGRAGAAGTPPTWHSAFANAKCSRGWGWVSPTARVFGCCGTGCLCPLQGTGGRSGEGSWGRG